MRQILTQNLPKISDDSAFELSPSASVFLSHDIRSAITGIVSAAQALESAGLTGDHLAQLTQINTAALYINDLLKTAADSDQIPVSELPYVLKQLEAMWKPEVALKGLQFSIVQTGDLPGSIRIPQIEFMRILNNIIGNALKFCKRGELEVRLVRVSSGALLVEIIDDGPGFSTKAQKNLFLLHEQPRSDTGQGSGYGLYIARTLLEKVGAEIKAENRAKGGARISIVFPENLLIEARKHEDSVDNGLPDLAHLKILLAEDNPTNQLVASQMLQKMGATVELASDGVEAIEAFERGDFNLGLIDIEMPRKSGLEVMREMRARTDKKAETTLLALTAYVLPEHQDRITAAGSDGIIAKPLTDIAAFGNAILIVTGEGEPTVLEATSEDEGNADFDIQMDIYTGLQKIIGHESMRELLGKVKTDLTDVRSGVVKGVATKDVAIIRASTHILISVAGAIGAVNLQHIAEALNVTAKTSDWKRIEGETTRCERGISGVLQFVDRELNSD